MHEVARKRLELRLALAHAAGIQGRERGAVIGKIAADGLEAIFARIFVLHVLPGDLEPGFVRFGTGVDEVAVIAATHQPVDFFRQRRGRRIHRRMREIRQLPQLVGGHPAVGAAIADIDAPQPGHGVEIFGAVGVDDRRTLAARRPSACPSVLCWTIGCRTLSRSCRTTASRTAGSGELESDITGLAR
jgi:hypothetical protein